MQPGSSGSTQRGKGHDHSTELSCVSAEEDSHEETASEASRCRMGCARSRGQDWGYSQRHMYDPIYTSFEGAEDIPYIQKPNLVQAQARGFAVINTDSWGLRAKTVGAAYGIKRPNEYRIAIVGESCTFGEGIARTEDTFAQVLEEILNKRQQAVNVKVFNYVDRPIVSKRWPRRSRSLN